jgi:hypothetical protein
MFSTDESASCSYVTPYQNIYIYIYNFHTLVYIRVFYITWNIFHSELWCFFWTSILCLNNFPSVDWDIQADGIETVCLNGRKSAVPHFVNLNKVVVQQLHKAKGYGNKRDCYILKLILICCIHSYNNSILYSNSLKKSVIQASKDSWPLVLAVDYILHGGSTQRWEAAVTQDKKDTVKRKNVYLEINPKMPYPRLQ